MIEENEKKPPWLITKNKYNLDEAVSALQKSIRRGLEEESMYWSLELSRSGYGQYLWRRLCVIASEDIGLIEPTVPVIINALAENCKRCTKSWKKPELLPIAHAVLFLCRCFKSREIDDYLEYIKLKIKKGYYLDIPEWAKDEHTESGRRYIKEKGIDPNKKFYLEGCLLNNERVVKGGNIYKKKLYKALNIKSRKAI